MYKQQAIIFTKDNAELIAKLTNLYTAKDLLDDYGYMFNEKNTSLVLVADVMDSGEVLVSHVVTHSMFNANATAPLLTDVAFHDVTQL